MPRRTHNKAVTWIGDKINSEFNLTKVVHFYDKFKFKNLIASVGDFVLVSNADAAEPDTEEGCDAAKIISLYEDPANSTDPYRAKVMWYSKPSDLPSWSQSHMESYSFYEREVLEDHRPFDTDISIETFFKKCHITLTFTKDTIDQLDVSPFHYVCRYRLMSLTKRKILIEPVMEEERKALLLLPATPNRTPRVVITRTPISLVKKMSRVSISEQKNWSVSKNDGTRLLLKRAILADKLEKDSPKKSTPATTPKSKSRANTPKNKMLSPNCMDDLITMELKENSDEELPTLIIRQNALTTPKRKQSVKPTEETHKKALVFEDVEPNTSLKQTRSGRKIKKEVNYQELEISPVKKTPQRTVRKLNLGDSSDDDFEPVVTPKLPRTPQTPRTPRTNKGTPKTPRTPRTNKGSPKTPRSVSRRIIPSQLTPSLHTRAHSIDNIDEFMKDNKSLPGREQQMEEIMSFVRSKLFSNTSGCMYISGVPGTGKTATVSSSLKFLKDEEDLPDFQLVEVNGMRIAEPRQAYVQIYKQLTGKTVVWEQACSLLEKRFNNPGPRRQPTVLLVDELDALCTRRQDVLYSIMEWASHDTGLLTVLAVANTMDLPERALAARVASRLGLTRLTFPPYTHPQLQAIVASRLHRANINADAIQLIARKVAAVSGDARRALALCGRALELAGQKEAGLAEVQQALGEATNSASVRAVRACAPAERLLLRAVASEVERTGSDETTLSRALATAGALVVLDGRPYKSAPSIRPPTSEQALTICSRLAAMRLLILEPKPSDPRLLLNISPDDVHYATKLISM